VNPTLACICTSSSTTGLLRRAGLAGLRPERPIEPMVRRLELGSIKAIERITRRIGPERGSGGIFSTRGRQQQRDQIRRALEQPVEPVIGFQTCPSGTAQPSNPITRIVRLHYCGQHPCFHGFASTLGCLRRAHPAGPRPHPGGGGGRRTEPLRRRPRVHAGAAGLRSRNCWGPTAGSAAPSPPSQRADRGGWRGCRGR
jgi:hypothetical protein